MMRYTGQLFDNATALYHLRARQYVPSDGRFLTIDPAPSSRRVPHVANYAYVENRPTVWVDPEGLFWGEGLLKKAWHTARFVKNLPKTTVGVIWASANGGSCRLRQGLMVECSGVYGWANGPQGALALGNTVITGDPLSPGLLAHETKHADQWAIFGDLFPVAYFGNALLTLGSPCLNFFEWWAGFEAGGYTECLSSGTASK